MLLNEYSANATYFTNIERTTAILRHGTDVKTRNTRAGYQNFESIAVIELLKIRGAFYGWMINCHLSVG